MKQAIYKYPVSPDASIEMPKGAQVLDVALQNGAPHLWVLVDPEAEKEVRYFRMIATGERFDTAGLAYLGTFHEVSGWMVFHLFEQRRT